MKKQTLSSTFSAVQTRTPQGTNNSTGETTMLNFNKFISGLMISVAVTSTCISNVQAAESSCMPIDGVAMGNFVPQSDGTTDIIASLLGSFSAASGKIIRSTKTATGFEMDIQHRFMNAKGGHFDTKDTAVLTAVPGKKDRYMLEITYHVQEDSTFGVLNGYKGTFKSFGLVDMVKNKGLVRYSGELCK